MMYRFLKRISSVLCLLHFLILNSFARQKKTRASRQQEVALIFPPLSSYFRDISTLVNCFSSGRLPPLGIPGAPYKTGRCFLLNEENATLLCGSKLAQFRKCNKLFPLFLCISFPLSRFTRKQI